MIFSLSSVGGSISASGFGPGRPNLRESKSVWTPAVNLTSLRAVHTHECVIKWRTGEQETKTE